MYLYSITCNREKHQKTAPAKSLSYTLTRERKESQSPHKGSTSANSYSNLILLVYILHSKEVTDHFDAEHIKNISVLLPLEIIGHI